MHNLIHSIITGVFIGGLVFVTLAIFVGLGNRINECRDISLWEVGDTAHDTLTKQEVIIEDITTLNGKCTYRVYIGNGDTKHISEEYLE